MLALTPTADEQIPVVTPAMVRALRTLGPGYAIVHAGGVLWLVRTPPSPVPGCPVVLAYETVATLEAAGHDDETIARSVLEPVAST